MRLRIEDKGKDGEESVFGVHWSTEGNSEPILVDEWSVFNLIKHAVDNQLGEFEIPDAYANLEFGCEVKWVEFPQFISSKIEELRRNQR